MLKLWCFRNAEQHRKWKETGRVETPGGVADWVRLPGSMERRQRVPPLVHTPVCIRFRHGISIYRTRRGLESRM